MLTALELVIIPEEPTARAFVLYDEAARHSRQGRRPIRPCWRWAADRPAWPNDQGRWLNCLCRLRAAVGS